MSAILVERTNMRVAVAALLTAAVGCGLMCAVDAIDWFSQHASIKNVLRELGGIFVATGLVAILWELACKRSFVAEIMASARISEDLARAGISATPEDFHRDVEWAKLFSGATRLDLFFSYAQTWRVTNAALLHTFARTPRAEARVMLPNPRNDELMGRLAERFETDAATVAGRINEAIDDLQAKFRDQPASLQIYLVNVDPHFTMYRFNHTAVISLHKHDRGRGGVPNICVEKGGRFFEFVQRQFDELASLGEVLQ